MEAAERILEKERDKATQLFQELLRGIDIEKTKKERTQEELENMHENFTKEELKYIKRKQDLELRIVELENEKLVLAVLLQ